MHVRVPSAASFNLSDVVRIMRHLIAITLNLRTQDGRPSAHLLFVRYSQSKEKPASDRNARSF